MTKTTDVGATAESVEEEQSLVSREGMMVVSDTSEAE